MKKIFKYIAVLASSVMAFGCYPEVLTPDAGQIPSASDFDVEITVDQETNYVTFTMKNQGVVPMWIFGDQKVDKTANTRYAYTQNGVTLRFRDAGTHEVEVKAYNAHGVSLGSQVYSFTLDNTYRDPFDPAPYMKAVAGEWMWNSGVKGHFGCGSINADTGQATTDGTDWWSCDPEGKAGMGLYDDFVTFTAEGGFTYDPGKDGTVYVNWGMAANGYHADCYNNDEQDYQAPIEGFTTTYTIENNWNAAGIEDIYLVLPEGKNLSYIPHKTALDSPRYRLLETNTSKIRKTLSLVNEEPAENGGGGIAWKYEFVPAMKVATPEELLAGTGAEGKAWVMDSAAPGHLGCGESVDNPAGWWSAAADEKKDYGMYDDAITFFPDGKYVYDSGEDGRMYINWGVTAIGPNPGVEPDIDIEQADVESSYTFDGETITLAANTPMVYVPSDLVWNEPVFHVVELTETTLKVVAENPGCYWQMIFKARDVKAPEQTIAGEPVASGKVTVSLTKGQSIEVSGMDLSTMWTDPDYFTYVDATHVTFNAVDGDYEIHYKESWLKVVPLNLDGAWATYDDSKALWIIGDNAGKPTDANLIGWTPENALPMARISENTYRITLALKTTGGSFKIFGQAAWGREFTHENHTTTDLGIFHITNGTDGGDPGNIYANDGVADGYYTLTVTDADGTLTAKVEEYVEAEKPFTPGAEVDLAEVADYLVGTWTWEPSAAAHFGCGPAVADPLSWWSGDPNCKNGCSLYDDTMTFAEDGTYTYDPVDGMTFMNNGVTKYSGEKVDNPTVPGAAAPEGDFRVKAEKQTATWEIDNSGEYPAIVLPAGTLFSYIPNDAFLDAPELYVTAMWENQVEISAYTATGNGGSSIAWRYRLKRVQ